MSIETRTSLQALYEETARKFAERLRERFPGSVHSVVLYGSVARKTAGKDSDIDVLVLADEGETLRAPLIDISGDLEYENNYDTIIETVLLTPSGFSEILEGKFILGEEVLREGIVLHDDGTFERIRTGALAVG